MKLLYPDIIITLGKTRSLLLDITRHDYIFIPNKFAKQIINNNFIIETISESDQEFKYFFNLMILKDFLFDIETLEEAKLFPRIRLDFNLPFTLSNAIIEFKEIDFFPFLEEIETNLEKLCVQSLEIRAFSFSHINSIIEFINYLSNSEKNTLREIQIIIGLENYKNIRLESICTKILKNNIVRVLNVYNTKRKPKIKDSRLIFSDKQVVSGKYCGLIDGSINSINLKIISEAINHNSCLHKKISIDIDGNIKNCPSMPQSFGNIEDTTLEEALAHKDFKKYWNLTKDHIEVCKDCEFRYICTDCRAYTERTHEIKEGLDVSKPLKCGYSPYTGEWEEWSTNPLKDKTIQYYELEKII